MILALALTVLPAGALAQAAAESALSNAASSAATSKTGSALNSALNQGTKKIAGRVQQSMSQPARGKQSPGEARRVSTTPVKAPAAREGTSPAEDPVIASIQGAATSCAPADRTASTPGSKTAAESEQTNRSGQDCAGKPAPQKNKSVITLSFSK
jgi:hypothetical protein